MIRFVEMKGIYIDDRNSFGFYNTVTDTFVGLSGSYAFDSIKDFEMMYDENCGVDYERMQSLIQQYWIENKQEKIGLLSKYINYIREVEGVDYVLDLDQRGICDVKFSDEEWDLLVKYARLSANGS